MADTEFIIYLLFREFHVSNSNDSIDNHKTKVQTQISPSCHVIVVRFILLFCILLTDTVSWYFRQRLRLKKYTKPVFPHLRSSHGRHVDGFGRRKLKRKDVRF
jgi:hypothetical protein